MERDRFYVVHQGDAWRIKHANEYIGPYETQTAAIDKAVHLAKTSGQDAQVLVQGEDNQFRTEWTYGHDPRRTKG